MNSLEYSAEVLKAIAQPTRLRIIELLRDGEHCVCEIFPAIGHEQSNTSRHLQTMLKSGILNQRHPEVLEVVRLAGLIAAHEAEQRAALFAR